MTRSQHPLLRPFPLVVMTIATFLVVFALLMARIQSQSLPATTATHVARVGAGSRPVVTRSSAAAGAAPAVAPSSASPSLEPGAAAPVTSRTSGGAIGAGERDD